MRYCGKLVLMVWSLFLVSCAVDEGNNEQMVNLQHVSDNPDTQLENLNTAIAQSKRDGSLYARRAVVLLRKGELEQALKDADKAVELTNNDPASLFVKAQVLRVMKREKEALALALQAERNSYQSSSLYVLLGELHLQRREYSQAREYLEKAHEISPADEFAFYYKGRVSAVTGDTARAIRNYKLALDNASSFMEPQRELAGIYIARNNFEAAEQYLENALLLAPNDGQLLYYKGLQYLVSQKQDSARQFFSKALAVNDTLQGAHYQLGLILHATGDSENAIAHLEKAAKKYRRQPKYITTLAVNYERTGQYTRALALYQRLVAQDPKYTYVYQSINRLKYKLQRPKPDSITVRQAISEQ